MDFSFDMVRKTGISIVLILCLNACLDPITIDVSSDNQELIVVDGQFNDSGEKQIVRLSTTQKFGLKSFDPVSGAQLQLCETESGLCESYTEAEAGIYGLLPQRITPSEGNTYFLQVGFSNGDSYQSTPQPLPRKQTADSVYHRFEFETDQFGQENTEKVINVYLDTKIDKGAGPVYMRWRYDELYIFPEESCGPLDFPTTCYVSVSRETQNILLLNSEVLEKSSLKGLKVVGRSYFEIIEYKNRHYFNVYQQSIGREAYEYWNKVETVIAQAGTIFDQPPASVPGNVINTNEPNDRLLGFFEVAAVDVKRTYVLPADFRENINFRTVCSQFNRRRWPEYCCNCLSLEGATTVRPDWVR